MNDATDWLDVYRIGRYASPVHRGVVPLWRRVVEQFRTDRYGRIWQAEAEGIGRCPRAWTRMGCVLKAMRWARDGRHGWGVHVGIADQFHAERRRRPR